jgi:hypothetical protein
MSKRTPGDIWKQLVDEAAEDEIERAASVSVEEAERELAAAGFDLAAERAKASAFLDGLAGGSLAERETAREDEDDGASRAVADVPAPAQAVAAVEQVAPPPVVVRRNRRRQRPVVLWLAAAATVTVGGGALYAALHSEPEPPAPPAPTIPPPTPAPVPSPAPVPPVASIAQDLVAATDRRRQAAAACAAEQWSLCLALLGEARALDPGGDDAPSVRAMRRRATLETEGKP